ncbi:hypothetical protein OCU04_008646 [Sclerotinia nivalis]|uniref:Retrotransposon gag domain-containing protein n=1 Tax=Sclerotinia nivalis TaxID=352851 RepID=A0A9X0AIH5_9HELO|nr:hypothetical protein OCU04_008646 [Sclerotinia nivalis]
MSIFDDAKAEELWNKINIDSVPEFDHRNIPSSVWLNTIKTIVKRVTRDPIYKPFVFFTIVQLKFKGKAQIWANNHTDFKTIFEDTETATQENELAFTKAFLNRYPSQDDENTAQNVMDSMNSLAQAKNETLEKYYSRAKDIQYDMGLNDIPASEKNLDVINATVQEKLVLNFVKGLIDSTLRNHSISNNAICRSLAESYYTIQSTKRNMELQDSLTNDEIVKELTDSISNTKSKGFTKEQKLEVLSQQLKSKPSFKKDNNSEGNYNSNNSRNQNRDGNNHRNNNNNRQDQNNDFQQISNQTRQANLPDPKTSKHPIVNGTEEYDPNKKPLCFSCGEYGHF